MERTKKLTMRALLISLALVLSYVERFIPLQLLVPLPGIKLGLANIVTLTVLLFWGVRDAFGILILRCVLGAIFGGGVSALAFSLAGGMLSMAVMVGARKIPVFSIYGVSILGAAAHNVGQIGVAMVLMNSVYVLGYLPYLLLVAVFMGFVTGAVSAGVYRGLSAAGQRPNQF